LNLVSPKHRLIKYILQNGKMELRSLKGLCTLLFSNGESLKVFKKRNDCLNLCFRKIRWRMDGSGIENLDKGIIRKHW
jgi:hypothetical protein